VTVKGVGFFPPRRLARVLWAGVDTCPELHLLQEQVRSTLSGVGVEGDGRKFHPHITLARFRRPSSPESVARFVAAHSLFTCSEARISEFHLYSSVLARGGAVHTREATYPLEN
jgi:2'-5' RNA ligase